MFCPKCGGEAAENQRYCKTCGTHLQMIYDALGGSETSRGIYGLDVEALSRNARKFAESWKAGWAGVTVEGKLVKDTSPAKHAQPQLPKPKEWLRYSWQHNLRDGLLSLFGGAGLGIALYYLTRHPLIYDLLKSIDPLSRTGVDLEAIGRLASFIWLFAAIPVLKGLGQIIYASFFAESMARLSERFIPAPAQLTVSSPADTAPQSPPFPQSHEAPAPRSFADLSEPVASVTEHTTQIIDGPHPAGTARASE